MLAGDQVPRGWRNWARSRERELLSGGVSRATASLFASAEARARAKIAASLGEQAARSARITWIDEGGGKGRFALTPGPEKLPRSVKLYAIFAPPEFFPQK